jgi:hypothetical protein
MRSLLLITLSLRAIGKLVGLGLVCLAVLGVVAILTNPGVAILGLLVLVLLTRAVIRAVRS